MILRMSIGQSYGSTKKIVKQGVRNIQTHKLQNVEKSQTSSDLNPMGIICNLGKSQRSHTGFSAFVLHLTYFISLTSCAIMSVQL